MILQMKAISKSFLGVKALDQVDFDLQKAEVHALLGENGAGKSTLMKILAGIYEPDTGEILLRGEPVKIISPANSQRLGISIIHQELNLIPFMSVAENIFLGREPRKWGLIDYQRMEKETLALLDQLGLELNPRSLIRSLSIGEQQIVEIAKALSLKAEIFIMDEPTAVLTERESQKLFALIQKLKQQGVSIIYISHRLHELKLFCDRITVLRDGQHVQTHPMAGIREREIANLMVGRELKELYPPIPQPRDEQILRVEKLTLAPHFYDISFGLQRGEVLGFAGLIGAGRSELATTIFGGSQADAGQIYWQNKRVSFRNPMEAVAEGIGFATEDRKETGLLLDMGIAQNITLPILPKLSRMNLINQAEERKLVAKQVEELQIKLRRLTEPVKNLSGGNQQKVILAKWLAAETELFLLDEPTRGIDVGAKSEIYRLIAELAANGKGVIVISSELPELLGLCNRIIVMHRGRITGELQHTEATEQSIMALATGL